MIFKGDVNVDSYQILRGAEASENINSWEREPESVKSK